MENIITIGIPKGSLEESTLSLFSKAGFSFTGSGGSLWLTSNDPELKPVLLRPQEIPVYVANGSLDCGLAGLDWIIENNSNEQVRILADLCYSKQTFRKIRWVLAVANDSPYQTVEDLKKLSSPLRISTELQNITRDWFAERGIIPEISFSWGATEAKVPVFADAIVDATETGTSLRENGLRIIDTLFVSTTQFFANKKIYKEDEWKRAKLDGIALLLKSCLAAATKVSIHVHVPCFVDLETIKEHIPESAYFSVWESEDKERLLEIIIDKNTARNLIPSLARKGAKKISVQLVSMLYE
jgi:ATP phosphoribosyltransferase